MAGHKALGRGLEALFSATPSNQKVESASLPESPATTAPTPNGLQVREILIGNIKPNRHQPRTVFEPESLQELSNSIKTHGLAQPLLVTETAVPGEYELVAGER